MRVLISSYLRHIATFIEVDDTPTKEETREKRLKCEDSVSTTAPGSKKQVPKPTEDKVVPTERPHIKPPRRKRQTEKKWNEESKSELMRDYMKDYRQTGKVMETNSPKNKYTKKPRN